MAEETEIQSGELMKATKEGEGWGEIQRRWIQATVSDTGRPNTVLKKKIKKICTEQMA